MEPTLQIDTLAALANETRLSVYRALKAAGPNGLAAGALASELSIAPNSLSNHLGILTRAGVVARRRHGRSIIYSANPDRVRALAKLLVDS
ncbi:helix-turn-helix transcriptional regulator [Sphingomonas sp. BK580]|uniref:ArsR/SmtB family transcription factor n=1 Tax=Sphingomonas sp. BK580 TaxID=2586972 RepID=UPI001622F446|nr:metalloregulator ArsR/SmtB family transcription factor [Sphingomonas sp. BK580]MBB3693618.1 DNA-binding transcriptional ArsR family regulator [Sphingomonas sp. BK580]